MKNARRAHLIDFLIGTVLIFLGIGMKSYGYRSGEYVLYAGFALYAIFWIWSVVLLLGASDLKPFQKRFWLIAILAVPVLGGLMFHVLHNKRNRITT